MTCSEARLLLDAYIDLELGVDSSLPIEEHLAGCSECSAVVRDLQALREELTPEVFDLSNEHQLRRLRARRRGLPPWLGWAVAAAVVVLAVAPILRNARAGDSASQELVDNHIRSLAVNHLVDVPSSDRHTVKPWFQGKVEFAPDVRDLKEKGFELIGGRLDIVQGRPAAAVVYKHGGHYVNAWTARTGAGDEKARFSSESGYQVAHWATGGLEHWVVSDVSAGDVKALVSELQGQ